MGKITIIIPCYNSEKFISKTLESIICQSYQDIEVLCINDGSTDNTFAVLQKYASQDIRIKVFSKLNGGIESVLRFSIPNISGDYVFLIGHDDWLSANALSYAVGGFSSDSVGAVRLDLIAVSETGKIIYEMRDRRILKGTDALDSTFPTWKIHTFCLWKKSVFLLIDQIPKLEIPNFDEYATRLFYANCEKVSYCQGEYFYLQHPDSLTRKFSIRRILPLKTNIMVRELFIEKNIYSARKYEIERALFRELFSVLVMRRKNKLNVEDELLANQIILEAKNQIKISNLLSERSPRAFFYYFLLKNPIFLWLLVNLYSVTK